MARDLFLVPRDQFPLPNPYIAPRTSTERQIVEIWRNALSMDRIGIEDSYNDLGGDSFLATIIFKAIEEKFGVNVPMAILAEAPTIARLALTIDNLVQK